MINNNHHWTSLFLDAHLMEFFDLPSSIKFLKSFLSMMLAYYLNYLTD